MQRLIELVAVADSVPASPSLRPASGADIPPGWYLLGQRHGREGARIAAVRCSALGEWQPVSGGDAQGASLILVDEAQAGLEVRADRDGASFPAAWLTPIGSLRAAWIMLQGIGRTSGPGVALAAAWTLLACSVALGASLALRQLFEHYQATVDGVDRGFGQRTWRLRQGMGPRSAGLALSAGRNVAGVSSDGPFRWHADGEQARLRVARVDGGSPTLRAGWYRLRGRVDALSGAWEAPQFSVRFAGVDQPMPVPLRFPEPDAGGWIDAPVLFDHDVATLDLEPSVSAVEFRMTDFSLQRLGRLRWPLQLLSGLRTPQGSTDWRGIADAIGSSVLHLLRGNPGAIGVDIGRRYHEANRRYARSYELWVQKYDTFTPADHAALQERGRAVASSGPLVSILLPVFETPEAWLRRCLDSVVAQAYPNWELCVADDASTLPHVRAVLEEFAQRDPRIRVAYRADNGHISEASNTALAMAAGEYVGLLDHDDELRPHALLEMVEAIVADRGRRVLYSDEDKIDAKDRRFEPYFKPDWNPDLLLGQNYLCHFTVIQTALARSVGGFRRGYEGSQDHDLVLRCTRGLPDAAIHHVSKVLYHWRAIPGSTALERTAKDYASVAGARAVADHLHALGVDGAVEHLAHGHYRVRWPLPAERPKVSLVIPTRDRVDLLRTCIDSVLAVTDYDDYECVVVDNQSSDPEALDYLAQLHGHPRVRVLRFDAPFNYSRINNWAVAQCDGELVCLLNNDIEAIDPGWLAEMAGHALRPGIGAVGAMLYYPDGSIQHAGVVLGLGGVANHIYAGQPAGFAGHGSRALVAQNLSAVTGACLLVRRSTYDRVGGLDERLEVAFNDIDFCLRLQEAGFRNVWTPFARLFHHESASRGAEDTAGKQQRFLAEVEHMQRRWGELLRRDPAYNCNLSLGDVNASLSFPPRAP